MALAAATSVLLAGALALELRSGDAVPDASPKPSGPSGPRNAALAEAPPVAAWTEAMLARPLFNPDRRPVPATRAGTGKSTLPRLAGTIRADRGALAIFQPTGGKPIVVGRGGVVADWTVSDITDGEVILLRGGSTTTLRTSYANLPVPSPQPVTAPQLLVLHERRSSPFLQP
jgi:hypothetical protein